MSSSLFGVFLLLLSSLANASESKCKLCKDIAHNFDKGLKDTAKSNFGGGNTHWEERSLGTYTFSETRLVEIMENLCKSGVSKDKCHSMVEENEELIEQWWFKVFAKDVDTPLGLWLCQRRLKLCCPSGTYGEDCKECLGGTEKPCSGHGSCSGDGTRTGSGECSCNSGYRGDECGECNKGFYEELNEEDGVKTCLKCDRSCKESCHKGGEKGCEECKEGWQMDADDTCVDVDECSVEESPCKDDEFCSNTVGSMNCIACDRACKGCTGRGADKCMECDAASHFMDVATSQCKACHTACDGCTGSLPNDCDQCNDGFTLNPDGECEDVDECLDEGSCSADEFCVNIPGKHRCSKCDTSCEGCTGKGADGCKVCKKGFESSEGECQDIDECVTRSGEICPGEGELCLNQPGSYTCRCKDGYKRKNKKCIKAPKKTARKAKRKTKTDCRTCKDIVIQFNKGIDDTENSNFGGGNTKWEEKKLGAYATSETRLVEIIENLCGDDGGKSEKCHTMVESSEELLERWWSDIYAKGEQTSQPLHEFLCINNLQVCCANGTYGPDCSSCKGGDTNPCQGNGNCDGEGTRAGNGTCACHQGYTGDTCTDCAEGFYEVPPTGPKETLKCTRCHESCDSTCWESGPKGCDECKEGFEQTEDEGCVDVNECDGKHDCKEDEFCHNLDGSFECLECPSGCSGCTSYDVCAQCREGYIQPEGSSVCADVNECEAGSCDGDHESCLNTPGSYSCFCEDGFQREGEICAEIQQDEEMLTMTGDVKTPEDVKDEL